MYNYIFIIQTTCWEINFRHKYFNCICFIIISRKAKNNCLSCLKDYVDWSNAFYWLTWINRLPIPIIKLFPNPYEVTSNSLISFIKFRISITERKIPQWRQFCKWWKCLDKRWTKIHLATNQWQRCRILEKIKKRSNRRKCQLCTNSNWNMVQ